MKDVLLITPPFTQLNTPYPATAYLKGFLNTKGISSFQTDLGIEVILKLFSRETLSLIFDFAFEQQNINTPNSQRIYTLKNDYLNTIDEVITFLQGENQTLARQISSELFLPQASRFDQLEDLDWAYGSVGVQDKAKHLATLYLEDLSDFIKDCVDEKFGFSRYAERLGLSANSFDELYGLLNNEASFIDQISLELLDEKIKLVNPKLICFSVPFPGNLYSAFKCAQFIKNQYPEIKTAMGGGFPNTELREVSDPRVCDFFDFITLDDGELPLELLITYILKSSNTSKFKRTFLRENGNVIFKNDSDRKDYSFSETGTPDYSDLHLDQYISVIEIANPMHSLWSDGRWNKLTMAHGCYWAKCSFCDTSLDYIKNYEPLSAKIIVDRIEEIISQTGEKGFHFVDEAAPPSLMKALAIEILKRKLTITWWTNIRFEKSFTLSLCKLLKASGCIAVSGGLEVASDRLLELINKGVNVAQVARVTHNFTEAGIMVHAYLMYGFPSQTVQETIDSLEMVRQMFELGLIQSGFWHQFALTAHSPIGLQPNKFRIIPGEKNTSFAYNDIQFKDKTGITHDKFSFGLKKSLYNFMHGIGFDFPLHDWFDFKVPKTTISKDFIEKSLNHFEEFVIKPNSKIVWIGNQPEVRQTQKKIKGKIETLLKLTFHDKSGTFDIEIDQKVGKWLVNKLNDLTIWNQNQVSLSDFKSDYESHFEEFNLFWFSKPIDTLKENGLIVV